MLTTTDIGIGCEAQGDSMSKNKNPSCFAEIIQLAIVDWGGQVELEDKIGIAQTTISDYARGNTLPSARRGKMIAKLLKIDTAMVESVLKLDRKRRHDGHQLSKWADKSSARIEKENEKASA